MTPRRLDPPAVQRRLAEIRRLAGNLAEVVPVDAQALAADWRTRAIVERLFEQIVELAVAVNLHVVAATTGEVPEEYRTSFLAAAEAGALPSDLAERLAPAAGLRNVLVHDYLEADLQLVADGVNRAPEDFDAYVTAVSRWLADTAGSSQR